MGRVVVVTGYTFTLTWPHCGGEVRHVTSSKEAHSKYGAAALADCTGCGSAYRVDVKLALLSGPALRQELCDSPPSPHEGAHRYQHGRNLNAQGAPLIAAMLEAGA